MSEKETPRPKTAEKVAPKRDWLDYLDVLIKIGSTIVVSFIMIFLNHSNALKQQEIDNSIKFGEFTQKLMEQLIKEDTTHLQQDLALITLNHTIGKNDSGFVADLAERILEKYLYSKGDKSRNSMQYVLKIIGQRDKNMYNTLVNKVGEYNKNSLLSKSSEIAEIGKPGKPTSIAATFTESELDKLTLVPSKATVFIQINNSDKTVRDSADVLLNTLKAKKYNTPGVEAVTKFSFPNSIKYYYDSDKETAMDIQKLVLSQSHKTIKLVKLDNGKARSGLIELWINY